MNALQKSLAKIPLLKPGMPFRDAFTSEGWNAMRDALFAVVRGEQIQRSGTVRVRRFPEGYSLWADAGGGVRAPTAEDTPPEDLLYVMGSSRDGSNDPDNHTAPPAKSAIQTDTYKSWEPPLYAAKVSVSSLSVGATTTINTGSAHNIPTTGGPYRVILSGITGITSDPDINGKHWATATDSDTFTIPLPTSGTLGGSGMVGLYCNGVKVNEWVRFYKVASGGGAFNESVWTRSEKKWNKGQFYVSEETLANVATISGSGSGGGGL